MRPETSDQRTGAAIGMNSCASSMRRGRLAEQGIALGRDRRVARRIHQLVGVGIAYCRDVAAKLAYEPRGRRGGCNFVEQDEIGRRIGARARGSGRSRPSRGRAPGRGGRRPVPAGNATRGSVYPCRAAGPPAHEARGAGPRAARRTMPGAQARERRRGPAQARSRGAVKAGTASALTKLPRSSACASKCRTSGLSSGPPRRAGTSPNNPETGSKRSAPRASLRC